MRDFQLTVSDVNLLYSSIIPKAYDIMALLIAFRFRLYFSHTCIVIAQFLFLMDL